MPAVWHVLNFCGFGGSQFFLVTETPEWWRFHALTHWGSPMNSGILKAVLSNTWELIKYTDLLNVTGRECLICMNGLFWARNQRCCLISLSWHRCYCSCGIEERTESGDAGWCSQCPAIRGLSQASDARAQAHSHYMAKGESVMVSSGIYVRLLTGFSFFKCQWIIFCLFLTFSKSTGSKRGHIG